MRHDILQLLNGTLAGFPIFLIVWAVVDMMRKISHFGKTNPSVVASHLPAGILGVS